VTASRLSVLLKTDIEAPSYRNFGLEALTTADLQSRPTDQLDKRGRRGLPASSSRPGGDAGRRLGAPAWLAGRPPPGTIYRWQPDVVRYRGFLTFRGSLSTVTRPSYPLQAVMCGTGMRALSQWSVHR
jgi:hypothetical protein